MNRKFYCYDIAARIDFLINNSGMTKKEVAEKIGISRSALYGATVPSLRIVVGVGRLFGADMNWLINGKGTPYGKK